MAAGCPARKGLWDIGLEPTTSCLPGCPARKGLWPGEAYAAALEGPHAARARGAFAFAAICIVSSLPTRHARKELVGQVCHRAAFPPTRPAHRGLWASAGRDIRRDDAHSPARKKLCMKTPPAGQPPQRVLHGTHLHAPFLPRDSPNACPRRPSRAVFSRAACLCLQRPSRFSADASSLRFSVLAFARPFAPTATARKAALRPFAHRFFRVIPQTPVPTPFALFRFGVRAPIRSCCNRAKGSVVPFAPVSSARFSNTCGSPRAFPLWRSRQARKKGARMPPSARVVCFMPDRGDPFVLRSPAYL